MSLPSEALDLIIHYSRPVFDTSDEIWEIVGDPNFHLTLAAVSTHWREAVLSKPVLWTTILFRNVRLARADKYAHYLQLCFERSKKLYLDISISFAKGEWDYSPHLLTSSSDTLILKNLDRIYDLRPQFPPYKWIAMIPTMPTLNTLGIISRFDDIISLPKLEIEALVDIFIRAPAREIRFQPCNESISRIKLTKVPIDVCIRLLQGCPSLIEFSCSRAGSPTDDFRSAILRGSLTLQYLSHFEWEVPGAPAIDWSDALMEHLRLPSLTSLVWRETNASAWGHSARLFFENLPTTFKNLRIVGVSDASVREVDIMGWIHYNTEVETVQMVDCGGELIRSLFENMLFEEGADEDDSFYFPLLESVVINGCRDSNGGTLHVLPAELGIIFAEALKAREESLLTFVLEMNSVGLEEWLPSVKDMLMELEQDGLDLAIYDRSRSVDWLEFKEVISDSFQDWIEQWD
ncbi:hypothetical protein NP233_g8291 [Leucocoprinus birnbaumii]|uniref:F-box domain-containing protein n=1 Tax=Leucocoprinus birnbaumii TaxID=56174 RepID=A0AAD5YTW0_9AGAR|nr:hypothetical protein NP233_g8291 [Leucocoprinus birnbaumii]